MKISPIYIYGTIGVLAILFLILFAQPEGEKKITELKRQMPDDDIHRDLQNPFSPSPGRDNVSEQTKHILEEMKKAVDANPDDTAAIREYADFLLAAHKPQEALTYYQQIINKDQRRPDILLSIAYVHFNNQNYDKAEEFVRRSLTIDKNNTDAIYNLGAILATKGEKDKAREVWEDLIKRFPGTEISQLAKSSIERM